jgi:NAD(P)-dependent dehydrogenase (short-subunit alcohol dehydrogenase family)
MLDHLLSVDVKAMFMALGRHIAPEKDNGVMVNISSMGGLVALRAAAAYVTSKTAVIGLTPRDRQRCDHWGYVAMLSAPASSKPT